jgi:hypothetical protein
MKSFDVVKYIGLGDIHGRVFCAIDPFPLENTEEALASRVVTAMPDGAHGTNQRISPQPPHRRKLSRPDRSGLDARENSVAYGGARRDRTADLYNAIARFIA